MNHDEFVSTCVNCGYASRLVAEKYAGERSSFTDSDIAEAYRISERIRAVQNGDIERAHGFRSFEGVRTTRRFMTLGGDGSEYNR